MEPVLSSKPIETLATCKPSSTERRTIVCHDKQEQVQRQKGITACLKEVKGCRAQIFISTAASIFAQ